MYICLRRINHQENNSTLKRNTSILAIIFFCYLTLGAQSKQDYVWIFSNDSEATEGNEAYGFDFNETDSLESLQGLVPIEISGLNASICDKDGNLLMYSNGCTVVDKNHQIMPNGRHLNNGDYFEMLGDSCFNGYLGKQDIMILPDPGYEQGYYILHKALMPGTPDRFIENRFSYVDLALNNGRGEILEKNVVMDSTLRPMSAYLTAINHTNGKDWWIIQPLKQSNDYLILNLDEGGFNTSIQKIGPLFDQWASASGKSVFSPDGSKYAYFNPYDNLLLYDFDRSSGKLSNLKTLKIKDTEEIYLSTIEFSPNSQFLYVGVLDSLWQIDTWEEDLEDGLELIDVWDGTMDPFATTFTVMALAPNCKIYMASGSSTNTYHVINKPNEKGKACDFVQRGIQLPYTSSLGNMPNFPRFRVDEEDKCDPTITSVFGKDVFYRRDLKAYPNPMHDFLTVEIPENRSGRLFLFDLNGQLVWQGVGQRSETKQIDFSFLEAGVYSLEFIPDKNPGSLLWTKQIVKQ